jgi:periplasmic mercuric ion binding protein
MMKTMKFIITSVVAFTISIATFSQMQSDIKTIKTEKIKVSGNCEMCKARIENAASIEGVTKAEWSDNTKVLTLVYDSSKVTGDEVQKKIASVGHDTEKYKADDKVYNKLPECCKYR